MALRLLNIVKGYFHDHGWLYNPSRAQIFHGMLQKVFRASFDFRIGESRVRFANGQKLLTVPYCKSVIGKQSMPPAVSIFDCGHDHVEGCEGLLELEPRPTAATRRVQRFWTFYDDAFMSGGDAPLDSALPNLLSNPDFETGN